MALMPVVAGVDGSAESMHAVEWAAMEAQRHKAPLRIVSAAAMPPRMRAYHAPAETVADELRDASARALSEAVTRSEEVSSGLLIDTDLLSGPPAGTVASCGSGARMLVVGARGAGGFAAMLLGSVSRYAAMHAACPVVVVREETCAVHLEVVVGIRDPHDAAATIDFAFSHRQARQRLRARRRRNPARVA
jgi:nucleotide-binding universal stress UspA family protein